MKKVLLISFLCVTVAFGADPTSTDLKKIADDAEFGETKLKDLCEGLTIPAICGSVQEFLGASNEKEKLMKHASMKLAMLIGEKKAAHLNSLKKCKNIEPKGKIGYEPEKQLQSPIRRRQRRSSASDIDDIGKYCKNVSDKKFQDNTELNFQNPCEAFRGKNAYLQQAEDMPETGYAKFQSKTEWMGIVSTAVESAGDVFEAGADTGKKKFAVTATTMMAVSAVKGVLKVAQAGFDFWGAKQEEERQKKIDALKAKAKEVDNDLAKYKACHEPDNVQLQCSMSQIFNLNKEMNSKLDTIVNWLPSIDNKLTIMNKLMHQSIDLIDKRTDEILGGNAIAIQQLSDLKDNLSWKSNQNMWSGFETFRNFYDNTFGETDPIKYQGIYSSKKRLSQQTCETILSGRQTLIDLDGYINRGDDFAYDVRPNTVVEATDKYYTLEEITLWTQAYKSKFTLLYNYFMFGQQMAAFIYDSPDEFDYIQIMLEDIQKSFMENLQKINTRTHCDTAHSECKSCNPAEKDYHLVTEKDVSKCKIVYCSCPNGKSATGPQCKPDNGYVNDQFQSKTISCSSCDVGYVLSNGKCTRQLPCQCQNGYGAASAVCHKDYQFSCDSCHSGYGLVSSSPPTCKLLRCACTNGYGATGTSCPGNNVHKCASCFGAYFLDKLDNIWQCFYNTFIPNTVHNHRWNSYGCIWKNGWYGTSIFCDPGYVMTGACGSGKNADCNNGNAYYSIRCCSVNDARIRSSNEYLAYGVQEYRSNYGSYASCPARSHIAVGGCGSGKNRDCNGVTNKLFCRTSKYLRHNPDDCTIIASNFGQDKFCPASYVLVSYCGSGGNRDCSGNSHIIKCCRGYLVNYTGSPTIGWTVNTE
jgi:hypothetical protein